mmetsp:Transcript_40314/g.85864  ORF Transcript_40314/g.85864 Transcript_40314/m.85864 type:complete len:201 (+) Transcript_40314:56-658(+)
MPYRPLGIPRALRAPLASMPSMGHVASPREVHASMYVMATSIVFFWDQVSADERVGSSCTLSGKMRDSRGNDRFRDSRRLARKDRTDTPSRTPNEIGTDRNRGSGYPLENNRTSILNFRSARDDRGRRVLDALLLAPLSPFASSMFSTRNSANRLPSLPHSRSATKAAVQSESRTLSAFLPRQYRARRSLPSLEWTRTTR